MAQFTSGPGNLPPYSIKEASLNDIQDAEGDIKELIEVVYRIEKILTKYNTPATDDSSAEKDNVYHLATNLLVDINRLSKHLSDLEANQDASYTPKQYFERLNGILVRLENIMLLNLDHVGRNPTLKLHMQFTRDQVYGKSLMFPAVKHCQTVLNSVSGEDSTGNE